MWVRVPGVHLTILFLGLAVGSASYLITNSQVFAPLRRQVDMLATIPHRRRWVGPMWQWMQGLIRCPYCTAHWLAFGAVALYRPWVVDLWRPLDFLVTSFVIIVVGMVAVAVIRTALKKHN